MSRITVLGAGAWGTAIALSLGANPDNQVTLWSHRAEAVDLLNRERENRRFLRGFRFPGTLAITANDAHAIARADIVVSVIPSEFLRATMQRLAPYAHAEQIFVSATKGVEDHTGLRMTEVLRACLVEANPDANALPVGVLSGPSFAQEVAAGMPTAVTIAFAESNAAALVQKEFSSASLRLYSSNDVVGVELGGALKNVIAIAAGVIAGLELGHNSSAALITRGIAEITRLAVAAGGRRETLAGLSGIGDLVLTCTGTLSRNRMVGFELGRGRGLADILAGLDGKVAEGVRTTRAALGLARKLDVEMPITEQMKLILDEGKSAQAAIRELMLRPTRDEQDRTS